GGSLRVLRGKGGKARTAPLPTDAAEAVDRWLDCRKPRAHRPSPTPGEKTLLSCPRSIPGAREAGWVDRAATPGRRLGGRLLPLDGLGTHELAGDATLRQRTRRHRPLRDRTTTSRSRPGMGRLAGGAWSSNKVLVVHGRPRGTLPPSGAVPTIPRARRGLSSDRTDR